MTGIRLLWHGAGPWIPTGYGVIAKQVVSRLREYPDVVSEIAWFPIGGPSHALWDYEGVRVYPTVEAKDMGESLIGRWAEHFRADAVVSVTDHWIWKTRVWETFTWLPIAFPDNEPLGRRLVQNLGMARHVIAPTRWGADALRAAGLPNTVYIPLGVDTAIYRRDEALRKEQRRIMIDTARRQGCPYLTEKCFIFGIVARNGTYPPRKGHDLVMDAVGQLLARGHRDFLVYMHSVADASMAGVDLIAMLNAYGRAYKDERLPRHVLFPPPTQMHMGPAAEGFDEHRMAALYNAMDVLVNPSQWEGFGLPAVEAAACGVPAIVTDVGCQPETGPVGWRIPVYRRFYAIVTDTFIAEPDLPSLVSAMEKAITEARNPQMQEAAERHALRYDWRAIVETQWLPFLESLDTSLRAASRGLVLAR